MRYAQIRKMDISNGKGIGVSIFVQGCPFHCKGCFNSETWNFNNGKEFTDKEKNNVYKYLDNDYINRFSILGGEPLACDNRKEVLQLILDVKNLYPNKTIWLWTGYVLENLISFNNGTINSILNNVDILVDGQFQEELKDLSLVYCGSSNQRVIDMKRTLKENKIITI